MPELNQFSGDPVLAQLTLKEFILSNPCNLTRKVVPAKTLNIPDKKVILKFESVDTDELKDLEIHVEGDKAIYKIGEGETSHFHIPNDKKLWETQFMICSIDGKFYIRDFGFVHTTRLKLDTRVEVQIQKGSVIDLGKVVHYHFDKVIHAQEPTSGEADNFYIIKQTKNYDVDDDYPQLRARPTWVSAEETVENIQNEINIISDGNKTENSIGRSMKRDVQIKLKAVSADHCKVEYNPEKGWMLSEKGKDKPSSNGTYIFLKDFQQMKDHMPSGLVPLHDGMILSFVNYELKVRIENKSNSA
jgi:predicted component of type VI protein secretion system